MTVIIHKKLLRNNLKKIRNFVCNTGIISIVKSNAYGHGLLETSKIIQDLTEYFGLIYIEEAIELRKNGIVKPIILLEGFFDIEEIFLISKYNIEVVIHNETQIKYLEEVRLDKPICIWMKLDIGMHRLGFRMEELELFYKKLKSLKNVKKPINFIGHFGYSKINFYSKINKRLNYFNELINKRNGRKSIASSLGIIFCRNSYLDFVRPGIIMYGVSPIIEKNCKNLGLKQAMTLKSVLISIKKCRIGDSIGYDEAWISSKNTYIGIVAIGYYDGYPNIKHGSYVLIKEKKVPIVGKISMNMISVNLGNKKNFCIGDEVIIWGDKLPVEKVASYTKISQYELLSGINPLIKRKYI
ncbi:hypothetical protein AOQ88_01780 [Candidatus Riesia sp. GBBU]|nr:hypothetical protein AOQ88_01780 [Candidatus Riesia sp. GBBU]